MHIKRYLTRDHAEPSLSVRPPRNRTGSVSFEINPTSHDGDRVIEKISDESGSSTLRREASVLGHLKSSHVVRLVELSESDSHTTMITADAGSRTLADTSRLSNTEVIRSLRGCIRAVKELHLRGWEHQRLEPSHVIIGPRGRIRLCSLRDAKHTALRESDDSGAAEANRSHGSRDVAALIGIIATLSQESPADVGLISRWQRGRLNKSLANIASRAGGVLRATSAPTEVLDYLDNLLKDIGTSEQREQPSMGSSPATKLQDRHQSNVALRGRRVAPIALVFVASTVGVLTMTSAASSRSQPRKPAAHQALGTRGPSESGEQKQRTGPHSTTTPPEDHSTTATLPEDHSTSTGSSLTVATSKDISETQSVNRVTVEGESFVVGDHGDVAVVGDWFCDGTNRVVVLRPSSGNLYLFDHTASQENPSVGRLVATQRGAVGLIRNSDGCGHPTASLRDGSKIAVNIGDLTGTTSATAGKQTSLSVAGGQ